MDTLIIQNVDFDLLELQRLALAEVLDAADPEGKAPNIAKPEDIRLVDGILNMLDIWSGRRRRERWRSWSDKLYYEQNLAEVPITNHTENKRR